MQLLAQGHGLLRRAQAQPVQDGQAALQVPLDQIVGLGIVVDVLMPLIGADHVREFVAGQAGMPFRPAGPKLRRTEQHFGSRGAHKVISPVTRQ